MFDVNRRTVVALGLTVAAAVPVLAFSGPAQAEVPNYSLTDGMDIGQGRRMVEVGMQESQIAAYKGIKVIDIIYAAGATDSPDDPAMDMDMICFILAGSFKIQKTGLAAYDVKEGDFYSCGIGNKDLATNTGSGIGIHRIALLLPA